MLVILPKYPHLVSSAQLMFNPFPSQVLRVSGNFEPNSLTLMLLLANLANTKLCKKKLRNYWNPGIWVLIWKYSTRAIQWIPTWQGLDVFQKSLHSCALDESSLSIGRVNERNISWIIEEELLNPTFNAIFLKILLCCEDITICVRSSVKALDVI